MVEREEGLARKLVIGGGTSHLISIFLTCLTLTVSAAPGCRNVSELTYYEVESIEFIHHSMNMID